MPHNDIICFHRKKFSIVTMACLGVAAANNVTSHVKFWKPGVAQVILMIFFERNFVFRRYPLVSDITISHETHEISIFVVYAKFWEPKHFLITKLSISIFLSIHNPRFPRGDGLRLSTWKVPKPCGPVGTKSVIQMIFSKRIFIVATRRKVVVDA